MKKLTGSCNCKTVKYQVDGDIKTIVNCHCGLCRKMNGAAFSTYVIVSDSDFKLLSGELKTCKVTEKSSKSICVYCGSPVFNSNPVFAGLKILHLGSVDSTHQLEPQLNIYCESQLNWLEDLTLLKSYQQDIS